MNIILFRGKKEKRRSRFSMTGHLPCVMPRAKHCGVAPHLIRVKMLAKI